MFRDLSIRVKIIIVFLLVGFIPVFLFSYMQFNNTKDTLIDEQVKNLTAITSSRRLHINQFIQMRQEQAKQISGAFELRQLTADAQNSIQVIDSIQAHIDSVYEEIGLLPKSAYENIDKTTDIQMIAIADSLGNIIAGTDGNFVGNKMTDRFLESLREQGIYFTGFQHNEVSEKNYIEIIQSIRNWEDKKFAGAVILHAYGDVLNNITMNSDGLGVSGESFLINNQKIRITDSRNFDNAVWNMIYDTPITQNCFEGQETSGVYKNKDGKSVVGVTKFLPDQNWCLISEIDLKEAFEPVLKLRDSSFWLEVFLLMVVFAASWTFGKTLTRPIMKTRNAVKSMRDGNLDVRVPIVSQDEIGQLGKTFNHMAEKISITQKELEDKAMELHQNLLLTTKQNEKLQENEQMMNCLIDDMEKEKQKLDKILMSIGDAVIVINSNHYVIIYNETAERILGYSHDDAIGADAKQLFHFSDESISIDEILDYPQTYREFKNQKIQSASGTLVTVSGTLVPLKNESDKVTGMVFVFRDSSREDRINKAKDEFVSLASHQLTTPLSVMSWYTEILLSDDIGSLNDNQKKYMYEIIDATKRMKKVVNAFLNLSQIEEGTFGGQSISIDVRELVEKILQNFAKKIEKKHLRIVKKITDSDCTIEVTPELLEVVIQNIIENAVDYTPEYKEIHIELAVESHTVVFRVNDTGYGIPKNDIPKLYTKFFRGTNIVSMGIDGTGLGLYTVKKILDDWQADIDIQSQENIGTDCCIRFPFICSRTDGEA